jgi:small subunit ribosomal protein S19e
MGVGLLRKLFGKSNRSRGARPEHCCKAAGGLIRHILIQLESCGLVEKMEDDLGGRKLSSAVRLLLSDLLLSSFKCNLKK